MTWNNRIFQIPHKTEPYYVLRETYYNENKEIIAHSEVDSHAFGLTVDELIESLEMQLIDAKKCKDDILVYGKVKFAENSWIDDEDILEEEEEIEEDEDQI